MTVVGGTKRPRRAARGGRSGWVAAVACAVLAVACGGGDQRGSRYAPVPAVATDGEVEGDEPATAREPCGLAGRELDDALVEAVEQRDVDRGRELLACGASVDAARGTDWTCIRLATARADVEMVRMLLDWSPDLERGSEPPLWMAVEDGSFEVVEQLLAGGADPNHRVRGRGALILALERQDEDVALALVSAGADVEERRQGDVPLVMAARSGSLRLVEAMLRAGADASDPAVAKLLGDSWFAERFPEIAAALDGGGGEDDDEVALEGLPEDYVEGPH